MKTTTFTEAEVIDPVDLDAIGINAREAIDAINSGAIGYPSHWAEFTIATPTATTARVSQGRYFTASAFYDLDAPIDISVTPHLPIVVGDTRYIALLARPVTQTNTAPRMIEIDAETGDTVEVQTPKTVHRNVEIVVQQGIASPTPLKPVIAANDCCIAFVLLSSTGIVAVESGQDWRVKTLYEVEGRVRVLEGQMLVAFQSVKTLQTDLAALAALMKRIPRPEVIMQLQKDAARVRRILSLPDDMRAYFYDPGLVKDQWEVTHGSWLARIREGVRFAFAAERDERLEVLNEADPNIKITGNMLLPDWSEVNRITVEGTGSFKNISQQVHTVTTAVERTVSRSSVEYGPTIATCENAGEWGQVGATRVGEQFQVNGETFVNLGLITSPTAELDLSIIQTWNPTVTVGEIVNWNQAPESVGHQGYAVQQVQSYSWSETYWEYVTETFGVNGSVYGQTWLNAQALILTSIDLNFTRAASEGTVHLHLCETDPTGAPRFDRVIATASRPANEIAVGWVKFNFTPRYLQAGRRYAWVTVTTGNHALATVTGSQYAQGTLFWSTDSAWFQGSPEEDFHFRVNAAAFRSNRTVIEFDPLTLENGMTQIHLIYPNWVPPGCTIVWQFQPTAETDWFDFKPYDDNPMNGLPALIRLRAVFVGTPDLAPAIEMSSKARAMTQRHRTDMAAISKVMNFGFTTDTFVVETVVDAYDPAHNTVQNRLIVGVDTITPTATTVEPDITKPGRYTVTSSFTLGAATGSARLRVNMTSDSPLKIPFIQNTSLFAI